MELVIYTIESKFLLKDLEMNALIRLFIINTEESSYQEMCIIFRMCQTNEDYIFHMLLVRKR